MAEKARVEAKQLAAQARLEAQHLATLADQRAQEWNEQMQSEMERLLK